MHVPFSYVRCPSCGSTFEMGTAIARLDDGAGNISSQTYHGGQHSALFTPASVLHTWKDIAGYVGRGVRTAQRWEHDFGLPVHRPNQRERSAVFAFPEEINDWLHRTPVGLCQEPALGSHRRPAQSGGRAGTTRNCA